MLLGKTQKFLSTAGIIGGKTTRLTNGLSVGDTYESNTNILPTAERYEWGYFIAISYDIL